MTTGDGGITLVVALALALAFVGVVTAVLWIGRWRARRAWTPRQVWPPRVPDSPEELRATLTMLDRQFGQWRRYEWPEYHAIAYLKKYGEHWHVFLSSSDRHFASAYVTAPGTVDPMRPDEGVVWQFTTVAGDTARKLFQVTPAQFTNPEPLRGSRPPSEPYMLVRP